MEQMKRRKKLSETDTIAMLKRIERVAVPLEELRNIQLCEKTVARFMLQKAKALFLASSCTANHKLTRCLEAAYYEAFKSARGHAMYVKSMEDHGIRLQEHPEPEVPDWFSRILASPEGGPQAKGY